MRKQTFLAGACLTVILSAFGMSLDAQDSSATKAASRSAVSLPENPSSPSAILKGMSWRNIGPNRGGRSLGIAGSSRRRMEYYFVWISIECLTLGPGCRWLKRIRWLSTCFAILTYLINLSRSSMIEKWRNSSVLTRDVFSLGLHTTFSRCYPSFYPLDGSRRRIRCSRLATRSKSGLQRPVRDLRLSLARETQARRSDLGWNKSRKTAWLWTFYGTKTI